MAGPPRTVQRTTAVVRWVVLHALRGASAASDEKCKETSISRREATRNASLLIQRTRISRRFATRNARFFAFSRRSLRSLLENPVAAVPPASRTTAPWIVS